MFQDDILNIQCTVKQDEGPEILKYQVFHAIKLAKTKKGIGPDEIRTDLLRLNHENHISALVKFLNHEYTTGEIPEE